MWPFTQLTRRGRAGRLLDDTPPLAHDTPEGTMCRVRGVVGRLDETLVAPLTGAACVAYDARVTVSMTRPQQQRGPRSLEPPILVRLVPFVVGDAIVDAEHADVLAPRRRAASRERVHSFLARFGLASLVTPLWARERIIAEGDEVEVAGVLMREGARMPSTDERAFRAGEHTSARIVGSDEHPIVIRRV